MSCCDTLLAMRPASDGFRKLPQILNKGPDTLEQRLIAAFVELTPFSASSYPTPALHQAFLRLRAEATREAGTTGALKATIAKMDEPERESMKQSLLTLADRVMRA
jgi:hypothetical protein